MTTKEIIIRILNCFENDSGSPQTEYDKIYLYHDGPGHVLQVTLGRGYTECGGSLWKVFTYYQQLKGKNAVKLLSYKKDNCQGSLADDKDFLNLIIQSARNEDVFRQAESQVFDDVYWNKGQNYFDQNGFKENLSLGVIEDSQLHSGGMLKFLVNSFPEKKPANGGDEKVWIQSYLNARLKWLSNGSGLLPHTVYRPKFFLSEIKKGNWSLACPLIANDSNVC